MAGIAENRRFATANTASEPASSRSLRLKLCRKRPQASWAATIEISAAAVSVAASSGTLR
jgi:hypothetical protein